MPVPDAIFSLSLDSSQARSISFPIQPGQLDTRMFWDYGDSGIVRVRIHFAAQNPPQNINLLQYSNVPTQAFAGHELPLALAQLPDEPLSIDGNPYQVQDPALVLFKDASSNLFIFRHCPHLPPHGQGQYLECLQASQGLIYRVE
jgi:hypothetical protein